jgi:hypothetical protein
MKSASLVFGAVGLAALCVAPTIADAGKFSTIISHNTDRMEVERPVSNAVRHDLGCMVYPSTSIPIPGLLGPVTLNTPSVVAITNTSGLTVPANTTVTYTVATSTRAASDSKALPPGSVFGIPYSADHQMACTAFTAF